MSCFTFGLQISSGEKQAAKMEVPLPLLPLESLRTRVFVSGRTINWPFLGAKKWDFGSPNPKTDTAFCRQVSPNMME